MANLTKRAIDSFRYRGGWDVHWDDQIPGFGVRIYPTGKKAFVLSYRARGRKRLMVLGRYGADLTLEEARTRARKERVKVRDGVDPLEEKRAASQGRSLGELIEAYVERHAKVHKKTWLTDKQRLDRHVPAAWKSRRADAIKREDIAELHDKIGRRWPYAANRLQEILRMMFSLARIWHFVDENAPNPAQGIVRFKEQKRKRWVTPEEVPHLVRSIDEENNVYVRAALWLYLLTGLRKTELLVAKHSDIDWHRAQLRLPDTKSGDEQQAALSAPAIMILRAIPKLAGNPYILPGARRGGHLVNIAKPWLRVRARASVRQWTEDDDPEVSRLVERLRQTLKREPNYAECIKAAGAQEMELPPGLADVRLHDLRRTVGSWLTQAQVDLNTIRSALRHASISTTLVYSHLGADPARAAMEDHGRRVMEIAGQPRLVEAERVKE